MFAAGFTAISTAAQEKPGWTARRSSVSFNAGVSIPFLCYGSTNINKSTSGYAKTGFTFNISYGYLFFKNGGLAATLFYSGNNAGSSRVTSSQSYRYFGIITGPLIRGSLSQKLKGEIKFSAGVAKVFTPQLKYGGEILLDKHQAAAFIWGGGIGLQYYFSDNTFFTLKADHANLKPQLKLKTGEAGKGEQHIVAMDIGAGIGIKF